MEISPSSCRYHFANNYDKLFQLKYCNVTVIQPKQELKLADAIKS